MTMTYNNERMLALIAVSIINKREVGMAFFVLEPTEEAVQAYSRNLLNEWSAFFQGNPLRSQVLAKCCEKANSLHCASLDEVPYFDVIQKAFDFEESEWFDNPHKVDQESWFYGMCHFDTVLGNEKDFTTPCHYED